ncbi:MAG: amidohydrolase [Gemmatimonadota bacterium]
MRSIRPKLAGSWLLIAGFCTLWAGCEAPSGQTADLVLHNGKVVTVDAAVPDGEAVAVLDGRILAVGSNREIEAYIGSDTEVIDLAGQLAIPGFIDSHVHFSGIGTAQLQLKLMEVANWDEVVQMVAAAVAAAEPGELIQGRGWHQEKWDRTPEPNVDGLPFHQTLDAVSPNNPVLLTHASGHATYANGRAMEIAGIDRTTPDPQGGEIVRDSAGNPIGVFRERAGRLLEAARTNASEPDPREVMELADQEVLSKGITSVHDAGVGFGTIDLYKQMIDEGALGVRMNAMIRLGNDELRARFPEYKTDNYGDHNLRVSTIKISIDGALGPHGAWLLEPYEDLPSSSGLNTAPVPEVEEAARIAAELGLQLAVHAIGDRANQESLNIFEKTFAAFPGNDDRRWRIEHSQHLSPSDIPRFGAMGVIPSMQGIHCTSDAPYVLERLGEERAEEGAYVWQKLMATGATIPNGTDAPVEDVSALASYYATVSRVLADGTVFFPDQRMSRMEALRSYTINGAYASFEEDIKGTLTPGKLADITVLSKDILTIPEGEIPTTEVVYTIVGGEVKYGRGGE